MKRELPDLDSKIHLTLGVDDGGHRRSFAGGNGSSDSVAGDSNSDFLALEPIHLHLHLGVHLNLNGEPSLHLQPRSQASQRVRVQILRPRQHRAEARLVVLVGGKRRNGTVPNGDRVREHRHGERVVEEDEVVVRVLGDESEVEERSEVCDGEFGTVRAVEYVECGADNGSEEGHREEGEDGPEAAAAAEVTVGALAATVVV
ncbi:hypothetical protein GmHk_06G015174 [Glycine max]|nr:hypothetical protein GmHk_06G015174 [Glycine max]